MDFKKHLKAMGMVQFLKNDTYIEYHNGNFAFLYNKKVKFPKKYIPNDELSLEKISFISDKRSIIGDILENNAVVKNRAFYITGTFDDYLIAAEAIRHIEMPSLGIQLQLRKTSNGEKHCIEPIAGNDFSINLNEASSGTQSSIPLTLIVEYFAKKYGRIACVEC